MAQLGLWGLFGMLHGLAMGAAFDYAKLQTLAAKESLSEDDKFQKEQTGRLLATQKFTEAHQKNISKQHQKMTANN